MRAVWKFIALNPIVEMPQGARIIRAMSGTDGFTGAEVVVIWAEVDTEAPKVENLFTQVGTGQSIPEGAEHVATWDDGPFVWHLYRQERA